MKPADNIDTKISSSKYSLRQRLAAFGSAMLLATALPVLAQTQKKTTEQKKQQPVAAQKAKASIPHLRVNVYDQGGLHYNSFFDLHEMPSLSSPVIVQYGDSIDVKDSMGNPVVVNGMTLDLLVARMNAGKIGDYLNNPHPIANRGPRAFNSRLDTERDGLTPGLYAIFPALEPNSKQISASEILFLYVQNQCPPPVKETKAIETEIINPKVPKALHEEEKTEAPKPVLKTEEPRTHEPRKDHYNRGSLLMINPFYTAQGNWGGDLALNVPLSRNIGMGAGIFFQPPKERTENALLQHDVYQVGPISVVGDTNLATKIDEEMYGVMLNLLFGKPHKVNLGIEGGVGWAKYHLKHTLVQTVKNESTGEDLKPEVVCNWSSDTKNQMIYRAGGLLMVPMGKSLYLFGGGGIIGNLPQSVRVRNNNGLIDTYVKLNEKPTDAYVKAGAGIRF